MDVARPELAGQDVANLRLARFVGKRIGQHAQVAAGPGHPRHVVQADVGIGLLRESLDEQQLVEPQQRIRESQAADGPAGVEVQAAPRVVGCRGRWLRQPRRDRLQFPFKGSRVQPGLPQVGGQQSAAPQDLAGRQWDRAGDWRRGELRGGPNAEAALIGRLVQGEIPRRVGLAVDFDFVQVEEDRLRAGDLQTHEAGLDLAGSERHL